ncbi:MAG: CHAT domain-containing protein [Blastocatellia bacterium]|nr:CHAT domain-containing protein [Blastocatellia bacterium]
MNPLLVGRRAIAGAVLCLSVFSNLPVFGRQAQPNSLVSSFQTTAAPVPTPTKLTVGVPVEKEMKGGERHLFELDVPAGQFVEMVVVQKGIDALTTVAGPDKKTICFFDSPNLEFGPQPAYFLAETAGTYEVEITTTNPTAQLGHYSIQVTEIRPSTENDAKRVAARILTGEADELITANQTKATFEEAIKKYETALEVWKETHNTIDVADAYSQIGSIALLFGDITKARSNFEQELHIRKELQDEARAGIILDLLGATYSNSGNPSKAIELHLQALAIQNRLETGSAKGTLLNNLGFVYNEIGEYRKAIEYYQQALPEIQKWGAKTIEISILLNLAATSGNLGEFQSGLRYAVQGIREAHSKSDKRLEAVGWLNLGSIYGDLGTPEKALISYEKALSLFRELGNRRGEATALSSLGTFYGPLKKQAKAIECFNQSLQIKRDLSLVVQEAQTLNSLGRIYYDSGDWEKAVEHYNQALALLSKSGPPSSPQLFMNLGAVYNKLHRFDEARDVSEKCLQLTRKQGDQSRESSAWYGLATTDYNLKNYQSALTNIEKAIQLNEQLRVQIVAPELKSSYFGERRNFYERKISILAALDSQNPKGDFLGQALQVSESLRARSLLELLNESHAKIERGGQSETLRRKVDLEERIAGKSNVLLTIKGVKGKEQRAETLERQILELKTELDQVEAEIRQTSPRYASLTLPQPLNLQEIRTQVLDPETVLLEFVVVSEDKSYLWFVSQDELLMFPLPKAEVLNPLAQKTYQALLNTNVRPNDPLKQSQAIAEYQQTAQELSNLILGPVAEKLGKKRLLIVADGTLQYLPFAALPIPQSPAISSNSTANQWTPLLVDHEIVSAPSASVLAFQRQDFKNRKPADHTLAILADPVFGIEDERFQVAGKGVKSKKSTAVAPPAQVAGRNEPQTKAELDLENLGREIELSNSQLKKSATETFLNTENLRIPRLYFSREEAQKIAALVPSGQVKIGLDFDANRELALNESLSRYRILHFATHGLLNSVHPELSGVLLSLVDQKGQPKDGFLRMADVFNLNLPADMVVLSACQTGLGKEVKGEGLVGLSRAFMYAGAERVMVSLWSVNDKATAELMTRFYRKVLKNQQRPAAALREAQLEMLREPKWKAPFYWAPFILQGEWR